MAQSVSCGTFKREADGVKAYLWTQKTWRHAGTIIVLPALLFLPALHSSTLRVPHWKWHWLQTLLKAPNTGVVSLGDCRKSGPLCWLCVKSATLGWELLLFLFLFFLFFLLNPTSSGKEPATDIIRWIFKRTKAPLRFFTLPVEKKDEQKPHPA